MCKEELISDVNYFIGILYANDGIRSYNYKGIDHKVTKQNKWLYKLKVEDIGIIRSDTMIRCQIGGLI